MIRLRIQKTATACLLLSTLGVLPSLSAKTEMWKDAQGATFKGEPVEVFGPLAFFKTGAPGGRRVPLLSLDKESKIKLYEQLRDKPARAGSWAEGRGVVTVDVKGNLKKVEGKKLVEADLRGLREPEFYLVYYVSHAIGKSWELMGSTMGTYAKLKAAHGDLFQAVMIGVGHSQLDQVNMSTGMNVPWYVADHYSQQSMGSLAKFAPGEGFSLILFNRQGLVISSYESPEGEQVKKAFLEIGAFLEAIKPENPNTWGATLAYMETIQPVAHANDHCEPLLIGSPVRVEGLKKLGISRVEATYTVGADGQVLSVELVKDPGLSEKTSASLSSALKKNAVFVPAVEKGVFVEGTYHFVLEPNHVF